MAVNDITVKDTTSFGEIGTRYHQVASNTSTQGTGSTYVPAFRAGEPVSKTLGNQYVTTLGTIGTGTSAKPVVGTDYLAGIAVSGKGALVSTETDTADGFVYVQPLVPNVVYLINIDSTITNVTDTQAHYNAKVGSRVLLKMTSAIPPVFTILATDGSTSGCVIENLDVTKYPGKVAFSFRNTLSYLD